MYTLHEIAVKFAKKQPGMADSITEEAPILKKVKWKAASHKMWNVAERLEEVTGPAFVEPDAPLPIMGTVSNLEHIDLHVLGGIMEVPTNRAQKFGGPAQYFAERQKYILKKAGMDTETQLVLKNWLKAAQANKNLTNAGGKAKGWFLLATRFDELNNVGLYDPDQFDQGRLLKITLPYKGAEHRLASPKYNGIWGYTVIYRGNFGWQILDGKRTCAAIVNIDEENPPTSMMIDDMLADVRAQSNNTCLFCCPKAKNHAVNIYKTDHVQLMSRENDAVTTIETWNGIPIITSHNISEKLDNFKF